MYPNEAVELGDEVHINDAVILRRSAGLYQQGGGHDVTDETALVLPTVFLIVETSDEPD